MSVPAPLVVVPCDPRDAAQLDVTVRSLVAVWATARDAAEVVVVADPGADAAIVAQLQALTGELGFGFGLTGVRTSLAAAVNPPLEEARTDGRDAVILDGDVEPAPGWLEALVARRDTADRPAAVVGGRLLYPEALIEHAGLQFSLLTHKFVPSYRFGPASLHEARVPRLCPIAPGMALIRHAALAELGPLPTDLPGVELTDYCLQAFAAGMECVYEPAALGTRHRRLFEPPPSEAEKRTRRALDKTLLIRHDGRLARWVAPVNA